MISTPRNSLESFHRFQMYLGFKLKGGLGIKKNFMITENPEHMEPNMYVL